MRQTSRRIPECSSLPVEAATLLGVVLDVYLLAPDVLLDDLGALHHVLAQPDFFLGHRPLVDNDLLLGHRHRDLVLAYLRLGRLAGDRHPLHRHLLVLDGDLYALAVGPHALADLDRAGLALAGACAKLLLGALHPELVVVRYLGAGLLVGVIRAGALGLGGAEAVVGAYLVLVLGRDLPVVVEGRAVLGRLLVRGHRDRPGRLVGGRELHRDEGAAGAQQAHLDAYVLGAIVLVEEQVVYLADLGAGVVVDRVAGVPVLYGGKPIGARLAVQVLPSSRDAFG